MEDPRRQFKIDYLKEMQNKIQHSSRAEFLALISQKFGEQWAGVVEKIEIEDTARRLMNEQVEAQLRELGE